MSTADPLLIHIDGAARGNPGPAAYAFIIARDGHPLVEEAACLGSTTNNFAEYTALVRALERAAELGPGPVHVKSDSELLVKQLNGEYRVKNAQLKELYDQATALCRRFPSVTLEHVRREHNSHADRLCNEVLDGARGPAAGKPAKARSKPAKSAPRIETVRDEAVACLNAAARAWSLGDPGAPTPAQVWDQLWSILEENGVLAKK